MCGKLRSLYLIFPFFWFIVFVLLHVSGNTPSVLRFVRIFVVTVECQDPYHVHGIHDRFASRYCSLRSLCESTVSRHL